MTTKKKAHEVFSCEICGSPDVQRRGNWDYCPRGHSYVGERAEVGGDA